MIIRREPTERVLVVPDTHFPLHDIPALNVTLQAIKVLRPTAYIHIGDVGEWSSVSHWEWKKKKRPPLEYQIPFIDIEIAEVNDCVDLIDEQLYKYNCKEKHQIVGNHDVWLDSFVEENPVIPQYGFIEALDLGKRGYTVHKLGEYYKRGHLRFTHGSQYSGVNHARNHLLATGCNLIYGDKHDVCTYSIKHIDGRKAAWCIGCLKKMDNETNLWLKGRPHNWGHALTFVDYFANGDFTVSVTEITNGRTFLWGQKLDGNKT